MNGGPEPWTIAAVATSEAATSAEQREPGALAGLAILLDGDRGRRAGAGPGRVWDAVCRCSWKRLRSAWSGMVPVPRGSAPGRRSPGLAVLRPHSWMIS